MRPSRRRFAPPQDDDTMLVAPRKNVIVRSARQGASRTTLEGDPASFPELNAGHGALVDLVRAVDDAHDARARPGIGQPEILADAGAAMRLDRPVDNGEQHLRRHYLDHRD